MKKPNREDIRRKIERARAGGELDIGYEDVTGVIDLVTERTRTVAEHCQKRARETIDELRDLIPKEA